MTATSTALEPFIHQKTILLTTYRRDGTPVGTPVSVVVEGDRAFVRTYDKAWKVKRIRKNSNVEIAPATTVRGKPTGPAIRARARLLSGDESVRAGQAIVRKYPLLHRLLVPLAHRLMRYQTVHFELTPVEPSGP